MSEVVGRRVEIGRSPREEAVTSLLTVARSAVEAYRASARRGRHADAEVLGAMQRLHLACEIVEHLK